MIGAMIEFFLTGGWVMYPLLLMSVLAITLVIERAVFWFSTPRRRGIAKLNEYTALLAGRGSAQAAKAASEDSSLEGTLVRSALGVSPSPNEAVAIAQIEGIRPSIDRFSTTLATIIAAAPLLGILGTVTGIIQSFDLLGDSSAVTDPAAVAGGIAEALYTTAFGLSVALVVLFPHAFFRAKAGQALSRLETLAAMFDKG